MYNLFFFILLLCNQRIRCSTIECLPFEIIAKVLEYDDFSPNDYLSKLTIAHTLNKNNFFQDSPQKILMCLGMQIPKLLLSCKNFYRYSSIDKKVTVPQEYERYIDFLIDNQSTFNLEGKEKFVAFNNFAFIFFGAGLDNLQGLYWYHEDKKKIEAIDKKAKTAD
jgi:hypothetical protein